MMLRPLTIALLAASLAALPALAMHCPADMAKIDAKLAENPVMTPEKLAEVKALRAEGERLHKEGKHKDSVEVLGKAMEMLGLK